MNTLLHFQLFAQYNKRMNAQIIDATSSLTHVQLRQSAGAFFDSILGTLNHVIVGDLLWLNRFSAHRDYYHVLFELSSLPMPTHLNQLLLTDRHELVVLRKKLDGMIVAWAEHNITIDDLSANFSYQSMTGINVSKNFGEVLSHFFNHQTHHRGQISTLLFQQGIDLGITDFIIDIPDM
ncbi:DinB family protein [Teredinibacter purpureus]|uniref:DinB family protein n=1 Tax=Teredinibacter purpureus TaxID=2731756 RepID=UPI0005F7BB8E|nr:DinB family protein [Teredinibacter purpureus]